MNLPDVFDIMNTRLSMPLNYLTTVYKSTVCQELCHDDIPRMDIEVSMVIRSDEG